MGEIKMTEFEKARDAAEIEVSEYHACYSGDCPHTNFNECLKEQNRQGADRAYEWLSKNNPLIGVDEIRQLTQEAEALAEALEKLTNCGICISRNINNGAYTALTRWRKYKDDT